MAKKHQTRLILLINPRFQWTVVLQGLCLIVLVTAQFYLYETFFMIKISQLVMDNSGAESHLVSKINDLHALIFPWFLICVAVTSFIILGFLFFFSHRVAGPLYHAVKYLNDVADDPKNIRQVKFREHDYFPELAEAINRAIPAAKD